MADGIFRQKVLDIVYEIPKGETLTYKEVAIRAGKPLAARAVGAIMRTNYNPDIPCHRVVKSDGSSGGYNRGQSLKIQRLIQEGVTLFTLRS
ncbi:MAG: MGMT family protein [Patescibacteria group bacterium]